MSTTGHGLTMNELCDLIHSEYRRRAIRTLAVAHRHDNTPVTIEDLAESITKPGLESQDKIQVSLFQEGVPRLASDGLIDYDDDQQLITPRQELTAVADELRHLRRNAANPEPPEKLDLPDDADTDT